MSRKTRDWSVRSQAPIRRLTHPTVCAAAMETSEREVIMTRAVSIGALIAIPPFAAALGYGTPAQADDSCAICPFGFTAALTNCVESIGVGLAPTANVQAYVPSEFTLASGGASTTPMVVRTSRCEGISFGQDVPLPVVVVQVGAVIVPPDGTGTLIISRFGTTRQICRSRFIFGRRE